MKHPRSYGYAIANGIACVHRRCEQLLSRVGRATTAEEGERPADNLEQYVSANLRQARRNILTAATTVVANPSVGPTILQWHGF